MKLKAFGSGDPSTVHPSQRGSCAALRSEAALQGELCQPQTKAQSLALCHRKFSAGSKRGCEAHQLPEPCSPQALSPQVQSAAGPSARCSEAALTSAHCYGGRCEQPRYSAQLGAERG